ncbi:MAG: outer membrane beta-barrel protein [Burkholderiales bacterium]|nr:outer membrane beta-barrel protein [Burkholderiales bacterium]MBX9890060.1 outer membrane beta-barrel protein [Amoebophilaceae bacterium]
MKKILFAILAISSGLSFAVDNPVYLDANIGVNTTYGAGLATGANIGYLFNPNLGLEGGITYGASNGSNWNSGNSYYMYDAAVKGILPLGDTFALYGKLGIAYNYYASCNGCSNGFNNGSNTGLLYGVGAQFNLSKSWSLHLEDYSVSGNNPNMLVAGGEFKF